MRFLFFSSHIVLWLVVTPFWGLAQPGNGEGLSIKELRKKADQQYELGDWYGAIESYEEAYQQARQKDAAPGKQYQLAATLGKLYRKIRNYRKAGFYYKTLAFERSGEYPKARFYTAMMVQQQGLYDSAQKLLKQVKERYQGPDAYATKKRVEAALAGTRKALKNGVASDTLTLTHLNRSINSPYSEFGPLLLNDTTLLYASRKVDSLLSIKRGGKVPQYTRFYKAHFEAGEWQHEGPWQAGPQLKGNVGNGAFSDDRKRFYFTKCAFRKAKQRMICKLYVAKREGGQWSDARKLPAPVNQEGVSSTHPTTTTVTKGRQKQPVLIFASDRERGRGKMDIWYSALDPESGDYSRPRNMGRKVNTKGNEVTPYFDTASSTLYFSSDSRAGYGGLDVYGVKGEFGRFRNEPRHLSAPVNSPADDLYYWTKGEKTGFLVSNRPGVTTLKHETCCDDLFATALPERDTAEQQLLAKQLTGKILKADTSMKADNKKTQSQTVVTLYQSDTAKRPFNKIITDTLKEQDSGRFRLALQDLDSNDQVFVKAKRRGFQSVASDTFVRKSLERGTTHARMYLKQKKVLADKGEASEKPEKVAKTDKGESQKTSRQQKRKAIKRADTQSVKAQPEVKQDPTQKAEDKTTAKAQTSKKESRPERTSTETTKTKPGNKPVVIPKVNYGFNKASLDEEAKNAIDTTVLELMQNNPEIRVQIRSHTDIAGSDAYNLKLSQRRAENVVDYLVEKGIERDRLVPKGFGERKPIAPNFELDGSDNPEGRRKNRRTEFKILDQSKAR